MDLDRPDGWFNLGTLAQAEGRAGDAFASFERALVLDAGYLPAREALAALR